MRFDPEHGTPEYVEKPTLTIRIPADLKRAVTQAAKRDDRSITSFVVKALRDALKTQGEGR